MILEPIVMTATEIRRVGSFSADELAELQKALDTAFAEVIAEPELVWLIVRHHIAKRLFRLVRDNPVVSSALAEIAVRKVRYKFSRDRSSRS
jgi:hypothetical protein